ncbi:unannotated protein [freshwater metagenome]|uniref:Unannotated protein n=1 Tax=freshwater metagenome TaxID=449393 RepID=A0A6J7JHC3_9ZZZZ|nr:SDR family NAD(P)-dependent oxidoreductase [Actinomycetota bacterium]
MSRKILVTGASSGIGRATTVQLAAKGHTVFAAARRTDRLEELARDTPGTIVPVTMDVCDQGSIDRAVAAVAEHAPDGLDVLVNNAGYALTGPLETIAADAFRAQYATNVFGLFDVTRAFLPAMRRRRSGRVVNVSSLLGRMAIPGSGAYSGTKHAVEALSDALRMELRPFGVDVVVVQPGFTSTDIDTTRSMVDNAGTIPDYVRSERDITAYLAGAEHAGATAEQVASVLVRACLTDRPRARYVAPATNAPVLKLLTGLPTTVSDRLKLRLIRAAGRQDAA